MNNHSYLEDGKARENGRRKVVCTFVVETADTCKMGQQMYIQSCVYHFHGLCRLRDNCVAEFFYSHSLFNSVIISVHYENTNSAKMGKGKSPNKSQHSSLSG